MDVSLFSPAAGAVLALLLIACAGPPSATRPAQGNSAAQPAAMAPKVLTLAISTPPTAFSLLGASVPAGGWVQITEIHSDGLITSAPNSRERIGRLSENVPTFESAWPVR